MIRDDHPRVETGAGVVRHLPSDEDELVADYRRDKPEVGVEATPGG